MNYDYFYGSQAESYSFIRVPRLLMTGEEFKGLSTDAKLLYALLLDRMGLSMRNGWLDEEGRVYIYYTVDEIQEDLNCGHGKACKLLAELDTVKGIGLIERKKQGQGKPTKIYVKQFAERESSPQPVQPKSESLHGRNADGHTPENAFQNRKEIILIRIILIRIILRTVILIHLSIHQRQRKLLRQCGSRSTTPCWLCPT